MTANTGETGEVPHMKEADDFPVVDHTSRRRPADTLANRLLLTRALAGHLSIREACERTGLNRGNWQGWERGLRPRDQVETCRVIADELDVDYHWLLFGGPLAGPQGPRVPKRSGPHRVTYPSGPQRPMPDRPKVREDPARRIYPQVGQARRAVRVNTNRPAEVIYAR